MNYGTLKLDTIVYTSGGFDASISVSGFVSTMSGVVNGLFPSGSAAAPSISVGTSGNGLYSPNTNQLSFSTSGTERFRVDSNGQLEAASLGTEALPVFTFTNDPDTGIYSPSANQISISTSGTERFRIDSTGQLEAVSLGTASIPVFTFTTDPDTGIYSPGANQLAVSTSGTQRFTVDSSGRLLVGTSTSLTGANISQYSRLQVVGNTVGNPGIIAAGNSLGASSISSGNTIGTVVFTDNAAGEYALISCVADAAGGTNDYPGRLVFSTASDGASSPTERLRIASNGVTTIQNGAVAVIGTLTDGATITPDFAANCNFTVTISGNRTLANPTNITAGQTGSIFIIQGSGSNTLSWGSYWDFPGGTAPTLSTASGAVDRVDYVVRSSTSIHTVFTANYS